MSRNYQDTLKDGDFTGATLKQDEFVTVATRKATSKQWYSFGYSNFTDSAGNFYAEFTVGDPDADGSNNPVHGEVRFVVYETDRMDEIKHKGGEVAIGDLFDLQNLRAADPSDRQTWDILPPQPIGAKKDEVVAMEVRCTNSAAAGNAIDTGLSDYKIPMLRRRV